MSDTSKHQLPSQEEAAASAWAFFRIPAGDCQTRTTFDVLNHATWWWMLVKRTDETGRAAWEHLADAGTYLTSVRHSASLNTGRLADVSTRHVPATRTRIAASSKSANTNSATLRPNSNLGIGIDWTSMLGSYFFASLSQRFGMADPGIAENDTRSGGACKVYFPTII